MLNRLLTLVPAFGPSGFETGAEEAIRTLADGWEFASDAMGNLSAHRYGNGERVMLSAHMDTIGLIVTYVEENGFARVSALGGIKPAAALAQRVLFENGVTGVVCADAGTANKDLTADRLYIDTFGETVHPGQTAVFTGLPIQQGDRIISPYLDNRIGCAVLLKVMETVNAPDKDLYFVFTAQEEVGSRGAATAAYAVMPDYAVVVDVCSASDVPGAKSEGIRIGAGPVLRIMDKNAIASPAVIRRMEQAAESKGISCQRLVSKTGGTDVRPILESRGGVPTAGIALPCRYIHTPNETVCLTDCEQAAALLCAMLEDPA